MQHINFIFFFLSLVIFSQEISINLNGDSIGFKSFSSHNNIILKSDTLMKINQGIYEFSNNDYDFKIYINEKKIYNLSIEEGSVLFDGLSKNEFISLNNFFNYYSSLIENLVDNKNYPDRYEIIMYDVKKKLKNYLYNEYNFEDNYNISLEFLSKYVDYIYYNSLCQFIIKNNKYKDNFSFNLIPYFLEESFYYESISKNLNFLLYKKYIYNMTLLLSVKNSTNQDQSIKSLFFSFYKFAKKNLNDDLLNYSINEFIFNYSRNINPSFLEEILLFYDNVKEEYITNVKLKYEKRNNYFDHTNADPDDSFKFYLEDTNANKTSLNNYLGKVVYIDIWASWCGPCRKLFPYSKKLKGKFSRKQLKKISFVNISIDNDYSKWKKSLKQLNIEGDNFISPSKINNSISDFFQISSIPRYIIIDKSGNIVDNNAKRPNDLSLYDDLIELLSK